MSLSLSLYLSFSLSFCLVRSCPLIILIKFLKGHKSLGSLCWCVFQKVPYSLSESVTRSPIELSAGQLKNVIIHHMNTFSKYILFANSKIILVRIFMHHLESVNMSQTLVMVWKYLWFIHINYETTILRKLFVWSNQ